MACQIDVSRTELRELAEQSIRQTNIAETFILEKYGRILDIQSLFDHHIYEQISGEMIALANEYGLPGYDAQTRDAVLNILPLENQYVLTHGTRDWGVYALARGGVPELADPDRLYHLRSFDSNFKSQSAKGVLQICDDFDLDPAEGLMVDNSYANLVPAHKSGMQTVLMCRGRQPVDPQSPYVSAQFETPSHLYDYFKSYRRFQPENALTKTAINDRPPSGGPSHD